MLQNRKYITDLATAQVPYNYVDLVQCGLPSMFSSVLAPDVEPSVVPKTVFCSQVHSRLVMHCECVHASARNTSDGQTHPPSLASQAAVLMLRNAISSSRQNALLVETLRRTNSRACSPMKLFNLLGPHCMRVDVAKYVASTVTRL